MKFLVALSLMLAVAYCAGGDAGAAADEKDVVVMSGTTFFETVGNGNWLMEL
jgi:hypothetical protein